MFIKLPTAGLSLQLSHIVRFEWNEEESIITFWMSDGSEVYEDDAEGATEVYEKMKKFEL